MAALAFSNLILKIEFWGRKKTHKVIVSVIIISIRNTAKRERGGKKKKKKKKGEDSVQLPILSWA